MNFKLKRVKSCSLKSESKALRSTSSEGFTFYTENNYSLYPLLSINE